MMDDAAIRSSARLMAEARRRRGRIAVPAPNLLPSNLAEAYAIQALVITELGGGGGWKVGKRAGGAAACAAIPTASIAYSPATLDAGLFHDALIEAEICFTLAHTIAVGGRPCSRAEMLAGIASCHVAIEVVLPIFDGFPNLDPDLILASGMANGALIVSGPAELQSAFMPGLNATLLKDGEEVAHGAANPFGDMIDLLLWQVNEADRFGVVLREGEVVSTGSWTGLQPVAAGSRYEAVFPGIGRAAVAFSR